MNDLSASHQFDVIVASLVTLLALFGSGLALFLFLRRSAIERQEIRRAFLAKFSADELLRMTENVEGRDLLHHVLVGPQRGGGLETGMAVVFGGLGAGCAAIYFHIPELGALAMVGTAAGIGQLIASIVAKRRGPVNEQ